MSRSSTKQRGTKLDAIDAAILKELQSSSKITNAMLSEKVGVSPPSTLERVRKLESKGIIQGYVALLDADALNQSILAIVHVSIREHTSESLEAAKKRLGEFEEVQACWYCAGDEDFILKVRVQDMDHYEQFVSKKLTTVRGISRMRTNFVLSAVKDTPAVPLSGLDVK